MLRTVTDLCLAAFGTASIAACSLPELHGLARDATMQLRRFWTEILEREPHLDGESVLDLLAILEAAAEI